MIFELEGVSSGISRSSRALAGQLEKTITKKGGKMSHALSPPSEVISKPRAKGETLMARRVRPVPQGHHTVAPYLIVRNAASALEFYRDAFQATELMRISSPQGRVGHAEIKIGNSVVMLADEYPEINARSPRSL